ncbi:class III extradiol ring-cleavage dioxygenase [Marinomonas sp. GJ51-6]|uniref:DODA-type extradiol aromatic ring-opening family dioxygenase n=1 Tax=Marinomonas sp. GJ51-6 TaxID=2992802 RepID=UPI00293439A7|nr:class III extradiol ring-cleavage dioxygenase [Marinomonas sp. GJ51-6]WOD06779.1 class III extradiol ring-cleavage dioxygenase [Marinomonas sp. GJ51-6]
MTSNRNIVYISHGGGPMPLLNDPSHKDMINILKEIAKEVGKPSAILVISAHWETQIPTVTSARAPELIYDYYGFPEESYQIQYPCAGSPELAHDILNSLQKHGIDATQDEHRGFDHGLFVPLKIMYPNADIPCVQLSLAKSLDAELHIQIGAALQTLDWDNLLVIGSGFSFHNMKAFFSKDSNQADVKNIEFDDWLTATMEDKNVSEEHRKQALIDWSSAPSARFCHPREEHLIPLHVCYGAANKASDHTYKAKILNKQASMFTWRC